MTERQLLQKPEVPNGSSLLSVVEAVGVPRDFMQLYPQYNISAGAENAFVILSSGGSSTDHPTIGAALQASRNHATGLRVPLAHHYVDIPKTIHARVAAGIAVEKGVVRAVYDTAKGRPIIIGGKSVGGVIAAGSLVGFDGDLPTLLMLGVPLNDIFRPYLEKYLSALAQRGGRAVAFQGTKDQYSNPEGVKALFEQVGLNPKDVAELGGDHDLGFEDNATKEELAKASTCLSDAIEMHVFGHSIA